MRLYVMLVFASDDDVADTRLLRARNARHARAIADNLIAIYPHSLGYQLWHEGRRVHSTHPVSAFELIAPIAVLLQRKLARRLQ